jgi:SNF2 family DNA or RNA helicase
MREGRLCYSRRPASTDFEFLLSTNAGCVGINLQAADTIIILDSNYISQTDLQAMDRAHRIEQKRPVKVIRIVSQSTVDEEIVVAARRKLSLVQSTLVFLLNINLSPDDYI